MQFTGLYDKNGKEIYEDDFLLDEMGDYHRIWKEAGKWLIGSLEKESDDYLTKYPVEKMIRVGNFYENKDLIKKQ